MGGYSYVDMPLSSVAVHWCLVMAHLYEEQTFIDIIGMAQNRCQPVVHPSTEQQRMHLAFESCCSASVTFGTANLHMCCCV